MGGKEGKGKKEGDFIEEESSTLACLMSAYAYCCLQVRAFPTETVENDGCGGND